MSRDEDGYNGWNSYATWRVNVEIVDEHINHIAVRAVFASVAEFAEYLENYVDDVVTNYRQLEGFAVDYARAFLDDVDWYELAETHASDYPTLIDAE